MSDSQHETDEGFDPLLDAEGMRIAFREIFEEARTEACLAIEPPERTLADGYYVRAGYIIWLELLLEKVPASELSPLDEGEIIGLNALQLVRKEESYAHPIQPQGEA